MVGLVSAALVLPLLFLIVWHHPSSPWSDPDSGLPFWAALVMIFPSAAALDQILHGGFARVTLGLSVQALCLGLLLAINRHRAPLVSRLRPHVERIEGWGEARTTREQVAAVLTYVVLPIAALAALLVWLAG